MNALAKATKLIRSGSVGDVVEMARVSHDILIDMILPLDTEICKITEQIATESYDLYKEYLGKGYSATKASDSVKRHIDLIKAKLDVYKTTHKQAMMYRVDLEKVSIALMQQDKTNKK